MSARDALAQIAQRADAATEGPWYWRNTQNVYLSGARTRVVMAFSRMGMQGAQPMFRDTENVLHDAGRENINNYPDAAFIAASRTDVPRLVAALGAVLDLAARPMRYTDEYADGYNAALRDTIAVIEQHLNDETKED